MSSTRPGSRQLGAQRHDELQDAWTEVIRFADEPAYRIVATRTLRLLAESAGSLRVEALADAADEPSDFDALLRLLEVLSPAPAAREPFFFARIRGARTKRELLSLEGPPLAGTMVAKHLGLTRQAVNKRRQAGNLIAVSAGRRGLLYPAWQFTDSGVLAGLEDALQELRNSDPWSQIRFFLTGDFRLNGAKPLDELRKGNVPPVLRAAKAFGEQGAS